MSEKQPYQFVEHNVPRQGERTVHAIVEMTAEDANEFNRAHVATRWRMHGIPAHLVPKREETQLDRIERKLDEMLASVMKPRVYIQPDGSAIQVALATPTPSPPEGE